MRKRKNTKKQIVLWKLFPFLDKANFAYFEKISLKFYSLDPLTMWVLMDTYTNLGILGIVELIAFQAEETATPTLKGPRLLQQEALLDGHLKKNKKGKK